MPSQSPVRASDRSDGPLCHLPTLFRRCQAGDARAREAIIVRFLPYAHHLARGYAGRGEPLQDLYQASTIGLINAVDRYEPARGEFVAFARPTILGEIRSHFRSSSWSVHVPRSVQDRCRRVVRAEKEIHAESSRQPSAALIAGRLGLDPGEVHDAWRALTANRSASLEAVSAEGEGEPLALRDAVGYVDPEYERVESRLGLVSALSGLLPSERAAVLLRVGAELTQTEIAACVGVSQMQVSRLLRRATRAVTAMLELDGRAAA